MTNDTDTGQDVVRFSKILKIFQRGRISVTRNFDYIVVTHPLKYR